MLPPPKASLRQESVPWELANCYFSITQGLSSNFLIYKHFPTGRNKPTFTPRFSFLLHQGCCNRAFCVPPWAHARWTHPVAEAMMQPPSAAGVLQQPAESWFMPKLCPISWAMVAATPMALSEWSCARSKRQVSIYLCLSCAPLGQWGEGNFSFVHVENICWRYSCL